ncbi:MULTISPECIES: AraC family transcriptional regulator [Arcobacteraceae]|jgi:AraC-like DNA-binding protein|uniref:AraC-like DNA-binding protein n=1 Tax=Malaciobacter marinus TaxID=505249 RepID=A0AB36ZSS4_9BACT|nr:MULTISPECIES: AraC family transcriptional regulator [Arcobacteraceae]PPK57882.1 AraC-like DNA-binding protein [Malaciobacter marinus]
MKKSIIENRKILYIEDGVHDTNLDSVKVFKTQTYEPKSPLIYDVCLILVLQGKKIANLASNSFTFDCDNYLVVPTTLPLECETYATKEEPFICLLISLDRKIMYDIIEKLNTRTFENKNNSTFGIFSDKVTQEIEDITSKLLDILESKEESTILAKGVLTELFYRIAIGKNAKMLHKMFLEENTESKIAKALKIIHDNYNENHDMETLARVCDMSVSSFHNHFKKITSHTPLQYIKKIRLTKAKEFLVKYDYKVVDVANELGYDNPSHFSRDFKSYFGYSPKEAKTSL